MPLSAMSTVDLQRVAVVVMRRYLDAEARPDAAAALDAVLVPGELEPELPGDADPRSIRHSRIGPVVVTRLGPHHVYATAPAGTGMVLEAELVEVAGRVHVRNVGPLQAQDVERQRRGALLGPPVPAHLSEVLHDAPRAERQRERWLTAAAVIDTYRERQGIDDAVASLGELPARPYAREQRQRALRHLLAVATELQRDEPGRRRTRDLRRDRSGPELGL